MPDEYKVKFTPAAYEDMDGIYDYIYSEFCDPAAAENIINEIETKVKRLADMPYSCPLVDDDLLKARGYRKLVINNFIALYIVSENINLVSIMRVVYGASNYVVNI